MITYKIHLIRHGITTGNQEGRYIGQTDVDLCREGIESLEQLKENFQYPAADLVVSSPLRRCTHTAEILYPDNKLVVWNEFTECDFGDFEGKSVEELQDSPVFRQWILEGMVEPPPNGESSGEMLQRVTTGIDRLFRHISQKQIYSTSLITHGGVITMLLYGMGLPKCSIKQCTVQSGFGVTITMIPQLWMRDHTFEIYGQIPEGHLPAEAQYE